METKCQVIDFVAHHPTMSEEVRKISSRLKVLQDLLRHQFHFIHRRFVVEILDEFEPMVPYMTPKQKNLLGELREVTEEGFYYA